jgi:hypothetical protein
MIKIVLSSLYIFIYNKNHRKTTPTGWKAIFFYLSLLENVKPRHMPPHP